VKYIIGGIIGAILGVAAGIAATCVTLGKAYREGQIILASDDVEEETSVDAE
jgi:hypothetical protein